MSWFGRLIGTEKAMDNILDKDSGLLAKAGAWVGNLNYTEEERAEATERTREWGLKQLEALAPFKVVQRVLAFSAAALWIFVGLNLLAAIWVNALTHGAIDARTDLMTLATSDYIWWPVMVVFALYFGGGVIPQRKP